jgi:uncharacterized OB-fold protein
MAAEDIVTRYATGAQSREFWQALADGQLLLPRCGSCEKVFFFPRKWCPSCWSDQVSFVPSPGTGEIFALSELHTAFQGVSPDELPVAVVLVELDEGVRLPGRLAKKSMPARIGDRVRLQFADEPALTLPEFVSESS